MKEFPFRVEETDDTLMVRRSTPKELAEVNAVVCRPLNWQLPERVKREYLDIMLTNEHGRCAACQRPIWFRPGLPSQTRKICVPCFLRAVPHKERKSTIYRMFLEQAKRYGEAP